MKVTAEHGENREVILTIEVEQVVGAEVCERRAVPRRPARSEW